MFTKFHYLFKIIFYIQFFLAPKAEQMTFWDGNSTQGDRRRPMKSTIPLIDQLLAVLKRLKIRPFVTRCCRSVQYIYQCLFIHICHLDKFVLWRAWIYQYVSFTWFSYRNTILILQVFSKLKNNSRLYWSLFSNVRRSDKSEPFALQLGKSHHFQFF